MADALARPTNLGHPLIHLTQTTSTNDVAMDMARSGAASGTLVIADEQSAGRGRRRRTWLATRNTSLLCSLIVRPRLAPAHAPRLIMLAALATCHAIRALGLAAAIKWPNDIMINGRKVAGILTETEIRGDRLEFAVIGIGINVNVPAADLAALSPQATSLLAETGRIFEREHVLRLLLAELDVRYGAMANDGGDTIMAEWRANLETMGRRVTVSAGDETIVGIAEDVDADGALLVRQESGTLVAVSFGDVS